MRRSLLPVLVLALVPLACRQLRALDPYPPAQRRLMQAARKILEGRHFLITNYDRAHGIVEGRSVVGANLAAKYRTVATARVYPIGTQEYDCEIRVTNELEISEASHLGRGQPPYDWRAAGFDKVLEATLMAELEAELGGSPTVAYPPSNYGMFVPPRGPVLRHSDLFKPRVPDLSPKKPKAQSKAPARAAQYGLRAVARRRGDARVARGRGSASPLQRREESRPPAEKLYDQYMSLGDRNLARRENTKALLEYQRAALIRPKSAAAHLSLAAVWTALDRYANAAESLRQAAAIQRGGALPAADVRRLRGLSTDIAQRLLLLKGWLEKNPGDHDARLLLAYHCILADRADEARKTLQQAGEAKPDDAVVAYLKRRLDQRRS